MKNKTVRSLFRALGIGARAHVALVGGGGKTSLLFALAEECRKKGKRVVTGTTTKVWYHESLRAPCTILVEADSLWMRTLKGGLERDGHVFLAHGRLDSGKVQGITPSRADALFRDSGTDYLLIEADGAAGRPVKAHAQHEPVIPGSVSLVIAVMGLEALGRTVGPKVVFRAESFSRVTGAGPGQRLTPAAVARLFLDPMGLFKGTPGSAHRLVFLNKWDVLHQDGPALDLASRLLEGAGGAIRRVVIGSIEQGRYLIVGKEDESDARREAGGDCGEHRG